MTKIIFLDVVTKNRVKVLKGTEKKNIYFFYGTEDQIELQSFFLIIIFDVMKKG